jgi:hypothetical protein
LIIELIKKLDFWEWYGIIVGSERYPRWVFQFFVLFKNKGAGYEKF